MLGPLLLALGGAWWLMRTKWRPLDRDLFITSGFRSKSRPGHNGVDLRAAVGTPVLAVAAGTVERAGWDPSGGGNFVRLRHADGTSTHYAHLDSVNTTRGAHVSAGDVIGHSGNTGASRGPHLHFAHKSASGQWLDPTGKLS